MKITIEFKNGRIFKWNPDESPYIYGSGVYSGAEGSIGFCRNIAEFNIYLTKFIEGDL